MLINPEAIVIITSNISPREKGSRSGETGEGEERQGEAKHKESHTEHITTSTAGFLKIWDTEKVSRGKVDAYLGVFFFFFPMQQSLQSLQAWLSIPNLDGCYNTVHYSDINWSGEISRECDYDVGCHGVVYKSNRKLLLLRVAFPRLASPASEVSPRNQLIPTQVVPALPHLTSLLKTDQQYNLITAALQRETSVNTSPFYLLIHLDK